MDFNYTLSNSMDDASGLMTGGVTGGAAFILNPLRQRDNYAFSNFDVRHIINTNFVWQLPFGKGRWLLGNSGRAVDAVLGGWQFSGIVRYNSGLPVSAPYDDARWATNWNVQSNATRTRPVDTCPTRGGALFGCNNTQAFQSFRNARPGETGQRNNFRGSGYSALDLGLSKSFKMPWKEGHKLEARFEVFNVLNYQYLNADNATRSTYGLSDDPAICVAAINCSASADFGNIYTSILGDPRRVQFGLRYSF